MPGEGIGLLALTAYAVFCWLFAPAALIGLALNNRKLEAFVFLILLAAIWCARSVTGKVEPPGEVNIQFLALAVLMWALWLAHFALPILLVARVFDLERRLAWLFDGPAFAWLLLADGIAVWFMASKHWLVPSGTEPWLRGGAFLVTLVGLFVLDRHRRGAT